MKKRDVRVATCDCNVIHTKTVKKVAAGMPETESLFELAEFYRNFGDSTRIGILCALRISEMCVCDLCALLNMTQSAVSHQLRILKQARLVRSRRAGKNIYYALCDEHIEDILHLGMKHTKE